MCSSFLPVGWARISTGDSRGSFSSGSLRSASPPWKSVWKFLRKSFLHLLEGLGELAPRPLVDLEDRLVQALPGLVEVVALGLEEIVALLLGVEFLKRHQVDRPQRPEDGPSGS